MCLQEGGFAYLHVCFEIKTIKTIRHLYIAALPTLTIFRYLSFLSTLGHYSVWKSVEQTFTLEVYRQHSHPQQNDFQY